MGTRLKSKLIKYFLKFLVVKKPTKRMPEYFPCVYKMRQKLIYLFVFTSKMFARRGGWTFGWLVGMFVSVAADGGVFLD